MTDHIRESLNWESERQREETIEKTKMSGTNGSVLEMLRQAIPLEQICKLVCSGKTCKHCNPNLPDGSSVIKGLDAQWVTEHILACSRPNTRRIKEFGIIEQFKSLGINTILNVQEVGEHGDCGDPLDKESGFSYNPSDFMRNGVFFYNYPFPDFSVPTSPSQSLDILRVVQYAVSQGKIAVHCHAGRGRTGLIIACYLIYNNRLGPEEAIAYVRRARKGSIQSQAQVDFILNFDKFLRRIRTIYAIPEDPIALESNAVERFTLEQFLARQTLQIKGNDVKILRHMPKILYVLIQCILKRCGVEFSLSYSFGNFTLQFTQAGSGTLMPLLQALVAPYKLGMDTRQASPPAVCNAQLNSDIVRLKQSVNSEPDSGYEQLTKETRLEVLTAMLWSWLDHLSEPVMRYVDVDTVCRSKSRVPSAKLRMLEKCQAHSFLLFVAFLKALGLKANATRLSSQSDECQLLDVLTLRCLTHLTQSRFDSDLVDLIRVRFGSVVDIVADTQQHVGLSTQTSASFLSLSTSGIFNESSATNELEQPFLWTADAFRLGEAHKRRLLVLLLNAVREMKTNAPINPHLSLEEPTIQQQPAVRVSPASSVVSQRTETGTPESLAPVIPNGSASARSSNADFRNLEEPADGLAEQAVHEEVSNPLSRNGTAEQNAADDQSSPRESAARDSDDTAVTDP